MVHQVLAKKINKKKINKKFEKSERFYGKILESTFLKYFKHLSFCRY